MADNEIIEVFENCVVKQRCDWQACPYYDFDRCEEEVAKDALSLINRLKAENERLSAELRRAEYCLSQIADDWEDWDD